MKEPSAQSNDADELARYRMQTQRKVVITYVLSTLDQR